MTRIDANMKPKERRFNNRRDSDRLGKAVSRWDGTNLQKATPNAFASRRRKRRSSFGPKITPSLRLLPAVGLRVFADLSMVKKFSRSTSKSRNTNPSSLALLELALDHSCRFACHAEVGRRRVSIRLPRQPAREHFRSSPAAPGEGGWLPRSLEYAALPRDRYASVAASAFAMLRYQGFAISAHFFPKKRRNFAPFFPEYVRGGLTLTTNEHQ